MQIKQPKPECSQISMKNSIILLGSLDRRVDMLNYQQFVI